MTDLVKRAGAALAVALLVTMAAGAADVGPEAAMIGWRGDGSGVFPADCKVPAEWGESRNVVWKTALPHAGNGSPICVGRRVFVLCEPGWTSDAPLLVCVDADSGKPLWQRDVDHFDLLPPEEQKQAKATRARWFEKYRTGMRFACEMAAAKDDAAKAVVQERMRAAGIAKIGFGHPSFVRDESRWIDTFRKTYNWVKPTWGLLPIGTTFPTPASDGRHVYVVTAFNTVACYDLEGNRKWIRWFRDDPLAYHEVARFVHSPVLAGGRLIVEGNRRLRAIDPATGQVVWDVATGHQLYMCGTPRPLRIGDVRAVASPAGVVVRLEDGKVLAEKIGLFAGGAGFVSDGKDTLFGVNGRSGGQYNCPDDRLFAREEELKGYMVAIRFAPAGRDRMEPALLWKAQVKGEDAPLYHDGRIYKGTVVLDAATGKVISAGRHRPPRSDQGWILVDGKLIGQRHDGTYPVVDAAAAKVLATNQLDAFPPEPTKEKLEQITSVAKCGETGTWYVWNAGRSLPFASGNRLFIRTFDALYAIGEPGAPFRPSAVFAAGS